MENTQYSPELEDQNYKAKNFLLFDLVVIVPIVYILILFILDSIDSANDHPYKTIFNINSSSDINLIFITFLGISIMIIFATYWFVLPVTMKKYEEIGYNESFFTFFLMFAINNAIIVFGFIIGILSWTINDHADWWKFLLLGGIGLIQTIYLYGWKIPKDYRRFSFKSSKK